MNFNFNGVIYRTANNWFSTINVAEFQSRPIKYLEIGTFYGANLFSVVDSYCSHPDSKAYSVDPWIDYDQYDEYKGSQEIIYSSWRTNLENFPQKNKIEERRGFSRDQISKFDDEFFDIIYIDGNHNPDFVLEDAVLSFRKLKVGGYLIFDDYTWAGQDGPQPGVDGFMKGYWKRIQYLNCIESQVFLKKMN